MESSVIDSIITTIMEVFDPVYILVCNAAVYFIISLIQSWNDSKMVVWQKRVTSAATALVLAVVFVIVFNHGLEEVVVGFFLQFLVYDYLLKPIIKRIQKKIGSVDNNADEDGV